MAEEIKTAGGAKVRKDRLESMLRRDWFTHGLIFDDVLVVSNPGTNCLVINTGEGLIVIDAILPCEEAFTAIRDGILAVGWNPEDIRIMLISHGHFDHCGAGRWIVEEYHPKTMLSRRDDEFWRDEPAMPQLEWTLKDFEISDYIQEGDLIHLGHTQIHVYETPGHTPGGLSFVLNVHERGQEYMAALWGGSNPMPDLPNILTYLRSLDRFSMLCDEQHVEVALMNHPFLNNALEKMERMKNDPSLPNPFLLGEHRFREFLLVYRQLCYNRLANLEDKR